MDRTTDRTTDRITRARLTDRLWVEVLHLVGFMPDRMEVAMAMGTRSIIRSIPEVIVEERRIRILAAPAPTRTELEDRSWLARIILLDVAIAAWGTRT